MTKRSHRPITTKGIVVTTMSEPTPRTKWLSKHGAPCGCIFTRAEPIGEWDFCPLHAAAPAMRREINPEQFDELAESLLASVENGDYDQIRAWAEWAADKAVTHRAILHSMEG